MKLPAYRVDNATPLFSREYLPYLLSQIDEAHSRIWASIFIVDARLYADPIRAVRTIIDRLGYAKWRGVDVRIIVGVSQQVPDIFVSNHTSAFALQKSGVDVRLFDSPNNQTTHSKYVIFDDAVSIVGSHNWTHDAFYLNIESSVAITSLDLVRSLVSEFETNWETSKEVLRYEE